MGKDKLLENKIPKANRKQRKKALKNSSLDIVKNNQSCYNLCYDFKYESNSCKIKKPTNEDFMIFYCTVEGIIFLYLALILFNTVY